MYVDQVCLVFRNLWLCIYHLAAHLTPTEIIPASCRFWSKWRTFFRRQICCAHIWKIKSDVDSFTVHIKLIVKVSCSIWYSDLFYSIDSMNLLYISYHICWEYVERKTYSDKPWLLRLQYSTWNPIDLIDFNWTFSFHNGLQKSLRFRTSQLNHLKTLV